MHLREQNQKYMEECDKVGIPKSTKTESALFTPDAVIRFIGVIAVNQVLSRSSESMMKRCIHAVGSHLKSNLRGLVF